MSAVKPPDGLNSFSASANTRRKSFKAYQISGVAECSARSVYAIKSNIRQYGSTRAPSNVGGRPRSLYQDEMALFLLDEFDIQVSTQSIGRMLKSNGWTKKRIHRVAKGRNADLRETRESLEHTLD
jgi:transposase